MMPCFLKKESLCIVFSHIYEILSSILEMQKFSSGKKKKVFFFFFKRKKINYVPFNDNIFRHFNFT